MNAISWFEIPAIDLERAFLFYHCVMDGHVRKGTFGGSELILFDVPFQDGSAVGGSVVVRDGMLPSAEGTLIYLTCPDNLKDTVQRTKDAGGVVLVSEMNLGAFGFAALILDSEGNRIGLLSNAQA